METFVPKGRIRGPILPLYAMERSISVGSKLLYAVLCNHAGERDHCWPSHARLAAEIGVSTTSIKVYLKELESEGMIAIRRESWRSSTYYLLALPGMSGKADAGPGSGDPRPDRRGADSAHPQADSGCRNNFRNQEKEFPPCPPATGPQATHAPRDGGGGGGFTFRNGVFERLWAAYPRKEAKELARSVWHRLWRNGRIPGLDALLKALSRFRASAGWNREHGRFIPQLANWLRGERWLDEQTAATPSGQAKGGVILVQAAPGERERRNALEAAKPVFEGLLARFGAEGARRRGPAYGLWSILALRGRTLSAEDVDEAAIRGGIMPWLEQARNRLNAESWENGRALA